MEKKSKIFSRKGPLFIITTIVSSILFLLFAIWIGLRIFFNPKVILGPTYYNPTTSGEIHVLKEERQPIKIWKVDDQGKRVDDFKIITLSDFHLDHNDNNCSLIFKVLDQILKKEQPDLVILLGDNIIGVTDDVRQKELINFFEQRNQYWTFVLGNHDGQAWEGIGYEYWNSRKEAFNTLCGISSSQTEPAQHCLARSLAFDEANPGTYGYGTNHIEVLGTNDTILSSLFFFDCEAIMHKNDQFVSWFDAEAETTRKGNKLPEILTFSHIPYVEMQEAYDKRKHDKDVKFNYGVKLEHICYDTDEKSGLFDNLVEKAKETKVTSVFGHDHVNNISLTYKGVKLMYTLGTQYNTYNTRTDGGFAALCNATHIIDNTLCPFLDGTTTYRIQAGKDVNISNRYNQLTGVFNPIQDFLWEHTHLYSYKNALPLTVFIRVMTITLTLGSITYYGLFIDNKLANKSKNKKKDK